MLPKPTFVFYKKPWFLLRMRRRHKNDLYIRVSLDDEIRAARCLIAYPHFSNYVTTFTAIRTQRPYRCYMVTIVRTDCQAGFVSFISHRGCVLFMLTELI